MENYHLEWENSLFLWSFSISKRQITRGLVGGNEIQYEIEFINKHEKANGHFVSCIYRNRAAAFDAVPGMFSSKISWDADHVCMRWWQLVTQTENTHICHIYIYILFT